MKKQFLFLTLLMGLMISCTQKADEYTVKAKIVNPENYTLFLAYATDDGYNIDTSYTVEDGWAVFKGKVNEPVVASFGVRGNPATTIQTDMGLIPGPTLSFVLTNDNITIEGDADEVYMAQVSGGKENADWNEVRDELSRMTRENWLANKMLFDPKQVEVDQAAVNKIRLANTERENQIKFDFIKSHPNSFVSMYFLATKVNELGLDELKEAYGNLGNQYKNVTYAKSVEEKIRGLEATAIGQSAIPFEKKDINNEMISIESLKGKYVLLDFWGSWCGPCRQSFPHLKELYAQYKDRGFEILGIAFEYGSTLEESMKPWKQAIEEDGLPWLQVLNNEDADNFDVVKAYGITAFPTQLLLDKEGKIIAKYVGESADLDQKLKEIFND